MGAEAQSKGNNELPKVAMVGMMVKNRHSSGKGKGGVDGKGNWAVHTVDRNTVG